MLSCCCMWCGVSEESKRHSREQSTQATIETEANNHTSSRERVSLALVFTATHCNTRRQEGECPLLSCLLQHTATHCNTRQHTATHCYTRRQESECPLLFCLLQHTATHGNTRQHTATHSNTRRHPDLCLSPHKHTRSLIYMKHTCSERTGRCSNLVLKMLILFL